MINIWKKTKQEGRELEWIEYFEVENRYVKLC